MKSSSVTSQERLSDPRIDPIVLAAIMYVSEYMGDHDDWVDIKIEIMNSLRPELRRLFSRRDQATREQVPNDFDNAVRREYMRVTGILPVVRTIAERKALRSGVDGE